MMFQLYFLLVQFECEQFLSFERVSGANCALVAATKSKNSQKQLAIMDTSVMDPYQDDYDTVLIGEDGNADDVNASFQNFSNDANSPPQSYPITQNQLTPIQIGIIKNIVQKKLHKNSDDEILLASRGEMQRAAQLTDQQLSEFLYAISFPFCQNVTTATALELYNDASNHNKLSLGCPYLDKYVYYYSNIHFKIFKWWSIMHWNYRNCWRIWIRKNTNLSPVGTQHHPSHRQRWIGRKSTVHVHGRKISSQTSQTND